MAVTPAGYEIEELSNLPEAIASALLLIMACHGSCPFRAGLYEASVLHKKAENINFHPTFLILRLCGGGVGVATGAMINRINNRRFHGNHMQAK